MIAVFGLLAMSSLVIAATIPVDLPPPDVKPPAKDKPVKVYILCGRSNMVNVLGFQRESLISIHPAVTCLALTCCQGSSSSGAEYDTM